MATQTRSVMAASRERDLMLSPTRAGSSSAAQDAPRTPVSYEGGHAYAGASASPRTPRTRSAMRALQETSALAYQTPDLDSIIMQEVYDYRSPTASKDELQRGERGLSLFSPESSRTTRSSHHGVQPGMHSPSAWPFNSPGLATFRLPTPDTYPLSPNTQMLYQFGIRREHIARPLLHDAMIMPQLPEAHFAGYPPGSESKRPRKERREKKTPTSSAPKRGEYRCGKCGFFPKKQKHNCATEKQKRPSASSERAAAQYAENTMGLPQVFYG